MKTNMGDETVSNREPMRSQLSNTTPGPWEISENGYGDLDICGPDAGDMIADLKGCSNAEANARLIAAAPELLARLEAITNILPDDEGGISIGPGQVRALQATIKAAKGGA